MSLSNNTLGELASILYSARTQSQPISQLTREYAALSVDEAYRIQSLLLERDTRAGHGLAGYKMGLTSKAKQRDVNVSEPICGYLTHNMEVADTVSIASLIHPRVEPEIAVVLTKNISGVRRMSDLLPAIGFVGPAIEILDSRYQNFTFQLADVIADNTSASHFLLGSTNYFSKLDELPQMGVALLKNGQVIETGTPAAVLGHPLSSVMMLVQLLEKQERELTEGQVILTGGITASTPAAPGQFFEVLMPGSSLRLLCRE